MKLIETKTPLTLTHCLHRLTLICPMNLPVRECFRGWMPLLKNRYELLFWMTLGWCWKGRTISILKLLSVAAVQVGIVAVQTLALYESRKAKQFFSVYVTSLAVYTHKSFGSLKYRGTFWWNCSLWAELQPLGRFFKYLVSINNDLNGLEPSYLKDFWSLGITASWEQKMFSWAIICRDLYGILVSRNCVFAWTSAQARSVAVASSAFCSGCCRAEIGITFFSDMSFNCQHFFQGHWTSVCPCVFEGGCY